jgi:hypothetical protein
VPKGGEMGLVMEVDAVAMTLRRIASRTIVTMTRKGHGFRTGLIICIVVGQRMRNGFLYEVNLVVYLITIRRDS